MNSFQLDKGLWLEDSHVLLPWDARGEELRRIGQPIVSEQSDRLLLVWKECTCLGGLRCQVEAHLYYSQQRNEFNSVRALKQLTLTPLDAREEGVRSQYDNAKQHLIERLGEPTTDTENYAGHGLPLAEWDLPDFKIVHMIFDRFGQYVVTEVWRKTKPT